MIIDRYLAREIVLTLFGVSLVLLLVFLSARLVSLLSEAAAGGLPVELILTVLALKNVNNLVYVLPLGFFLGVMLGLSRLYRDNEMVALAACGVGIGRVVRTVLVLALAMMALVGFLSLYASPWAEDRSQEIVDRAAATADIRGVAAGRFSNIGSGQGVLYVEELSEDRSIIENVFVFYREPEGTNLVTARAGRQYTDPDTGERYLVLSNGHRLLESEASDTLTRFGSYGVRIREPQYTPSERRRRARSNEALLASGALADIAEVQWRVSMALWVVVLGLAAVPLSHTSPREGRYARIFTALVVYVIYGTFVSVGKTWLEQGVVPPFIGLWWAHVLMLGFALWLLLHGRLRTAWRRRAA